MLWGCACRYLHWDPFALSYPLPGPPVHGKTTWDFTGIDPYVEDFMSHSAGHDAVINFAPMFRWGVNNTGYIDPTGQAAGEYFSRIVSWYTQGGFVDELGVKHVSNYTYDWKYWEVLNEVDAGSSGTACKSLNATAAIALDCATRCCCARARARAGDAHHDHALCPPSINTPATAAAAPGTLQQVLRRLVHRLCPRARTGTPDLQVHAALRRDRDGDEAGPPHAAVHRARPRLARVRQLRAMVYLLS